ncbi:MAG TPA: c-type cytochrome [Gemmatimonadales bacterium]|nr:c-type cytochrome [Gemmatimonadales bacterium]
MRASVAIAALFVFVSALPVPLPASPFPQDTSAGKDVYRKWCAGCHGVDGKGDGEGARHMIPTPRDFTGALYQIRSTPSGQLPTDADLLRAIDEGLAGTAMPGWKSRLSDRQRRAVLAYIKTFSTFFADTTQRPQPITFGSAPGGGSGAEALRVGRQFYDSIGCRKCHGDQGRGDGPSAPTLKDDAQHPIFAANLHENWRFNGGGSVEDIYHRLRTGLDGTPMPSFSDLLENKFLTDEQLWRVAQYVRSLSPKEAPMVRDVIHAPLTKVLPHAPDDSAWTSVDLYWFPLVGQIVHKERWFAPAVSGVWVKAVHTADSIALRVVWDDRSASPDTAWLGHVGRVWATLESDDSTREQPAAWPDQLVVQFPISIPSGMERPYFLMGSSSAPVYQWRWSSSARSAAVAGLARGIDRFDPLSGAGPGAQAVYDHGQWRLVFTRALASADTASQLPFRTGCAIPVAFFASDGSNGEHGTRMAISTWYFLALDEPVPARVFISPVLAMLLTLGLGMLVVWRAQQKTSYRRGRQQ